MSPHLVQPFFFLGAPTAISQWTQLADLQDKQAVCKPQLRGVINILDHWFADAVRFMRVDLIF